MTPGSRVARDKNTFEANDLHCGRGRPVIRGGPWRDQAGNYIYRVCPKKCSSLTHKKTFPLPFFLDAENSICFWDLRITFGSTVAIIGADSAIGSDGAIVGDEIGNGDAFVAPADRRDAASTSVRRHTDRGNARIAAAAAAAAGSRRLKCATGRTKADENGRK